MSADPRQPPLHLPEDIHYECIQCGQSCGEFWEIPVEDAKADEINARDPRPLAKAGAAAPHDLVVESPWTPGRRVMRMEGGACCALGADKLCTIHKAYGFEAKPNICRSFPYRYIETPAGDFVGLSFACTAVLRGEGPAVADQREALLERRAWTHNKRHLDGEPGPLTTDIPLSWDQYEHLEADLADLLDPALGSLERRLLAQSAYLTLMTRFLRQARSEAGDLMGGPEANEQPLKLFRVRMRGTPGEPWPLPLRMADKRGGQPLIRRMVLGFAHGLRNTYGERRGRARSYAMALSTYLSHALGRGRIAMPTLSRPIATREIDAVRYGANMPELAPLLERYLRHRLFRKDLLLADSIQLGHQLQLLHWGLIHWYAAAMAADAGRDAVNFDDLVEAIRNVEKFFVFHSTFDRLFSRYPLFRGFVDRLFAHPLYAYAMAHPG